MTRDAQPICLVGQALVDVTLPRAGQPYKMRLGGIIHAARALWAAKVPYTLAYAAPDYLSAQVEAYAAAHGAVAARRFADVDGSPNVILIGDVKEAGDQGYEYLLRDEHRSSIDVPALRQLLADVPPSDLLVITGGFDLREVLVAGRDAGALLHVDLTGVSDDWLIIKSSPTPLETVTLSTSSRLYHEHFHATPASYWDEVLPNVARAALLKENRGGSRMRAATSPIIIAAPAFLGETEHSVGVGDCFDAVWIALRRSHSDHEALTYASLVAADYASTTYPDAFRDSAMASLNLPPSEALEAVGVTLPWERRGEINVYIAAPDFDFVDRAPIDVVAAALKYHNFKPRLPVRENGQMGVDATAARKAKLLAADLDLLDQCQVVVAVLTYNDPGTLIEIGIACERKMPTIIYDLAGRAENLVLTGLPTLVTGDLERVITCVYEQASQLPAESR